MQLPRLSTNSLWLLVSRVGSQLGLALFTILLARGLGTTAFGEYAFMASVIVVGNVLTTFGTDMFLIREIAATEDVSRLASALWIQLALSVVFIGVVLAAPVLLSAQDIAAVTAIRIYSFSMLPLAFYTVFTTALRGRQRMGSYAALSVSLVLMQLAAGAWLLWRHEGLVILSILLLFVQVAAALLAGILCAVRIPGFARIWTMRLGGVVPLIKASAPIALLGVLGIIYQRFNLLVLPALAGAAATGWFSVAARLVEAAKIAHVAIFTALYPMMAAARTSGEPRWTKGFRIPAVVLLAGALVASLGLWLLAGFLIPILFGAQYLPAVPILRILGWILLPYALNNFLTLLLLARGEEHLVAWALGLSLCVLVVLTLWWTPAAGVLGAAWAALCAEFAQSVALLLQDVRRPRVVISLFNSARSAN